MSTYEITISEKLYQLVNEYAGDRYCVELFRFFGAHPYTWFNRLAVIHALEFDCRKSYLERALILLVGRGVVGTKTENNVLLYSLSDDESVRSLSLKLATLDWPQIQLMLNRLCVAEEAKVSWSTPS